MSSSRRIAVTDAEAFLAYFARLTRLDPERVERPEDVAKLDVSMELSWIERRLDAERAGEMVVRCAEADGEIVALGELERLRRWIERHVAEIRFGVLPGHQEAARELVADLESRAREKGIEVLVYFHLATQTAGLAIMRSLGYEEIGRIPRFYKRDSEYVERVYLTKRL